MPVSLEGMTRSWTAVETLTGARGAHEQRPFVAYRLAAEQRVRAIHDALRTRYCEAERDRLGLDGGDGRQRVWDGGQGLSLGEVACAMAAAGNTISEYDGPGMFSKGQRFKTDVPGYGYHTLELHQAEVAPGSQMLLGHQLQDANGQRALTVQQWLGYLAQATRVPSRGDRRCADPGLAEAAEERPAAGLLALGCQLPAVQAGR